MGVLENKKNKAFQKIVELSNEPNKDVELSRGAVELGLVQDIEKQSKNVFKQSGRMDSVVQKIEKAQGELKDEFIKLEQELSSLDSQYQQLKRNASVLGVDVPTAAENAYKTALALIKNDMATYRKYKG